MSAATASTSSMRRRSRALTTGSRSTATCGSTNCAISNATSKKRKGSTDMNDTTHMNEAIHMNDAMHMTDTIVVEIDIAAPPARVFEAWTDPQQRMAWWGDDAAYRSTKMESDLRVGGKWRTEGKNVQGKPFSVSGEYTRLEPPKVL